MAVNRKQSGRFSVSFVDLKTDKVTPLAGAGFPFTLPSLDCALRVGEHEGRPYLMRFDFDTGKDIPLHPVYKDMKLLGVIRNGQLALLGTHYFKMPLYLVIHIPNGRQHRMHPPGILSSPSLAEMIAANPGTSPFSPDDKHFVLQTIGYGSIKTLLYTIPLDWDIRIGI